MVKNYADSFISRLDSGKQPISSPKAFGWVIFPKKIVQTTCVKAAIGIAG